MPLQRSSRFCPDWWMTHRMLLALSLFSVAPAFWPASVSGWPMQVMAWLAARYAGSQPALSRTTGIPAATALAMVGFIRLGLWSETAMPLTWAFTASWIWAFSALSSGSA